MNYLKYYLMTKILKDFSNINFSYKLYCKLYSTERIDLKEGELITFVITSNPIISFGFGLKANKRTIIFYVMDKLFLNGG